MYKLEDLIHPKCPQHQSIVFT